MVAEPQLVPSIDAFTALSRSRHSIRGFDPNREVPNELVEQIVEAARWAPSGGNGQPWHFVVIRDAESRAWNMELYLKQIEPKLELERAVHGNVHVGSIGFKHAPVHILIVGDLRVNESYPVRTKLEKSPRHFYSGLANATLTLMLAASCLGLATQYVSDASSPYMATLLKVRYGIPDPLEVYELIPVGWPPPKFVPSPTTRRPLDSVLHREVFERDKLLTDEEMLAFLQRDTRLGGFGKVAKRATKNS